MIRSKPIAGRHLGWDDTDRATKPYARFFDPQIQPLPDHIRHALDRGPLPEPLLPALDAAPNSLFGQSAGIENGFARTAHGAVIVAARTDLPGVTPAMIDWWFTGTATARNATSSGIRWRTYTPRGCRRHGRAAAVARAILEQRPSWTSISAAP
jgi:hypothetical protein